MITKTFILPAVAFMAATGLWAQSANIDQRVEALMGKMTQAEKIGQLNILPFDKAAKAQIAKGEVGALTGHLDFDEKRRLQEAAVKESRLGIPLLFAFDVVHGYKTIFPIPLAQAASWNLSAIEDAERIAAREASADGQHWTFAPVADVTREPRWGGMMESAGEDTYLASRIAEARVRGFQGEDLSDPATIAACVRHFAGYGFLEGGREYGPVDLSRFRLRSTVLPPFQAAVEAGCAAVMSAPASINGMPAGANPYLLKDILRDEWSFDGVVVASGAGAPDQRLRAGCDAGPFGAGLQKALEQNLVGQEDIDRAVRRVLTLKFKLGLFDDPYRYLNPVRRDTTLENPRFREAARKLAAESMVLLKNDGGLLPIREGDPFKKIAIVGPLADSKSPGDYLSRFTGALDETTGAITPAMALKPTLESMGFEVTVTEICINATCDEKAYSAALKAAREADLVICCVGESGQAVGTDRSVSSLDLPGGQETILRIVARSNKPVVMVLFNSRPLVFPWANENVPAILAAWQPGLEAGNALADVITGQVNPSGKLPFTWPASAGQIPVYYNAPSYPDNDGYIDGPSKPAYPFGYGLSYTRFGYSGLVVTPPANKGAPTEVRVDVTNTGQVAGEEVVQLYVQNLEPGGSHPAKSLKGFEKIFLQPGERKTLRFHLSPDDFGYWTREGDFRTDPGTFKVFVGGNSRDGVDVMVIR